MAPTTAQDVRLIQDHLAGPLRGRANGPAVAGLHRLAESHDRLLAALETAETVLDGRQPIDVPGALMVIRSALAKARKD